MLGKSLRSKTIPKLVSGNFIISYPMRNFSFNELTHMYLRRQATVNMMIEINKKEAYRKLPIHTKFIQAFTLKKRRFAYLIILWLLWYYDCHNKIGKWYVDMFTFIILALVKIYLQLDSNHYKFKFNRE